MVTANQMIQRARAHIGEDGCQTWAWFNSNVYYAGTGWSWCAAFLSKCATECGLKHENSASAAAFGSQFKRVQDKDVKPGDVVTFNWDGRQDTSWMDHVALVVSFDHQTGIFSTIDGNSGNDNWSSTVKANVYDNNASYFTAFWRPIYTNEKTVLVDARTTKSLGARWTGMQSGSLGKGVTGKYGKLLAFFTTNMTGGRGYRVYTHHGGWLPFIKKYDVSDLHDGCAGNGWAIYGIQVDDPSVRVRVHQKGKKYTSGKSKGKYKWEAWVKGGKAIKTARPIDKIQVEKI